MKKSRVFIGIGVLAGLIAMVAVLLLNLGPQGVDASSRLEFPSALPDVPLTVQSDPQEILALMLHSHTTWDTMSLSAVETARDLEDDNTVESETRIQIQQPDKASLERALGDQKYIWRTDGDTILIELADLNIYTTQVVRDDVKDSFENFVSPTEADSNEPVVYPHPFGVGIPTALNDLIYPTGIAQNMLQNAEVTVLDEDRIANRPTIVFSRQHTSEDGTIAKKHIYWIDAETGVILKYQVCIPEGKGRSYEYGCNWVSQVSVTQILFDASVTANTFDLTPISTESKFVPWDELERQLWGQSPSDLPFIQQERK